MKKRIMRYVVLGALALATSSFGATNLHAEKLLRIANMGEPASLDPHFVSGVWENRIVGEIFLGLTTEAQDGSIIPGAAESWKISPDGRVYTFKLRDQMWSDGVKVTAEDFNYAYRRILAPETPAKYASLLYTIKNAEAFKRGETKDLGVKAVDEKTLEITLEGPTPYFLAQLVHYTAYPVPKHAVEKFGKDWTKPGNIVSNGAYMVTEWVPNDHIKAVKNPKFYDAAKVKIDAVVWYPGEDRAQAQKRLRANEVDICTDFASDQIELLKRELPKETKIAPYQGLYFFTLNTTRKPFDNKNVRLALSMAVDRDVIANQVLKTGEIPAYGYVPPNTANYPESVSASFKMMSQKDRDAKALELMKAAGYTPEKPLKFTISYNTSENHKKISIALASMWKKIGVEAELSNAEVAVHYKNMEEANYDVARGGWIADYNDAQNFLFLVATSTGKLNYSRYSNPEFDWQMAEAAVNTDLKKRGEFLKKAEAIAIADMPMIPIYFYVSKNLVSQKVIGWKDTSRDIHRIRWLDLAS